MLLWLTKTLWQLYTQKTHNLIRVTQKMRKSQHLFAVQPKTLSLVFSSERSLCVSISAAASSYTLKSVCLHDSALLPASSDSVQLCYFLTDLLPLILVSRILMKANLFGNPQSNCGSFSLETFISLFFSMEVINMLIFWGNIHPSIH